MVESSKPDTGAEEVDGAHGGKAHRRHHSALDGDPSKDVILAVEFVSDQATRLGKLGSVFACSLALGLLIFLVIEKFQGINSLTKNDLLFRLNVTVGAVCLVIVLCAYIFLSRRIRKVQRLGRRWAPFRKQRVTFVYLQLVATSLYLTVFLMPNILWFTAACNPVGTAVSICLYLQLSLFMLIFTIFASSAHSAMPLPRNGEAVPWLPLFNWLRRRGKAQIPEGAVHVAELPIWVHLDKVIFIWVPAQICFILQLIFMLGVLGKPEIRVLQPIDPSETDISCRDYYSQVMRDAGNCLVNSGPAIMALSSTGLGWVLLTLLYTMVLIFRVYAELARYRYQQHRTANIQVRLVAAARAWSHTIMVLCIVFYWFVHMHSCASYIMTAYGFAPWMFFTAYQALYDTMSSRPVLSVGEHYTLHTWLQEGAWIEEEVAEIMSDRPPTCAWEPVFCLETALKAFYYSLIVYDYNGIDGLRPRPVTDSAGATRDGTLSMATALSLLDLDEHAGISEPRHDLSCMVAWSARTRTIALTFRGTASMANVWLDLQAWQKRHPAGAARKWNSLPPRVHAGFYSCWHTYGFGERVLARVDELIRADGLAGEAAPWRVLCFGHSLGGALACMCAASVAQLGTSLAKEAAARLGPDAPLPDVLRVSSYTYGCPRLGNHAFARYYAQAVPDGWDLVHNNDVVARNGKFFHMYKRAAKRVVISPSGDLIIRPSLAERTVLRGRSSLQAHLMLTYAESLIAVLEAHARGLGGPSARQGIAALVGKASLDGLLRASPFILTNETLLTLAGETAPALPTGKTSSGSELDAFEGPSDLHGLTPKLLRQLWGFIRDTLITAVASPLPDEN